VKIKIPAGTEGGRVFRLRGHGVPDVRAGSQKGDLYVRVQIAVPKKMSSRQEQLLREFANEAGDDVYPERSSFLGKVKDFWGEISNENKP